MIIDIRRSQAIQKLQQNKELLQVYQREKKNIDEIVDQALNYPLGANRWDAYSALKQQASLLTGWHAFSGELASSRHYTVLIDFIDYLLSLHRESVDDGEIDKVDDDEIDEFEDEYDEEEAPITLYVDGWHQHAKEVLAKLQSQQALQRSPKTIEQTNIDTFMGSLLGNDNETEY